MFAQGQWWRYAQGAIDQLKIAPVAQTLSLLNQRLRFLMHMKKLYTDVNMAVVMKQHPIQNVEIVISIW